jgi:predicted neuraminidase
MLYWLFAAVLLAQTRQETAPGRYSAELIFPLHAAHNHAPGIVELPDGDLLASWYRGSGERSADDVAIYAARRKKGANSWDEPFLLADTPGFPDCNTALFLDSRKQLWLFYPTILANTWESCLTNFKVSSHYEHSGVPRWDRERIIFLKPDDFGEQGRKLLDEQLERRGAQLTVDQNTRLDELRRRLGDKLSQRLGWQPRCKPTELPSGRLLLPLYSDTYSISIMAITDDGGKTWQASKPLIGFGNIQPAVLRRNDGTLLAFMRENGPRDRVRVAESRDDGSTWGRVGETDLPNPGSGLDGIRLASGHWLLIYNDTVRGRNKLAASLSSDEGRTWTKTRHLEDHAEGSYHYPAVIQSADGTIHCVYSYFVAGGKSMKHAAFDEDWVLAGDAK